ncbi:hypothetical protein K7432_006904 [Basidiobolus ranarum]|uniref:Yeast cell wall synthesis Kre9/Knh1-like N-terminal domain-containing protein n=1 Tax=Basidiobolus ranarum TaxID=34480 RepID=A0ABR2WU48_9FUNG
MLFTFLTSVALLANSAFAGYYITQPVDGTRWVPGTNVTVSWTESNEPVTANTFDITLMFGKAENLAEVSTLVKGLSGKTGTYKWKVPENLSAGPQYAIRIGSGSDAFYSHFFSIEASKLSSTSGKPTTTGAFGINSVSDAPSPTGASSVSSSSTAVRSSPASTLSSTPTAAIADAKVPTAMNGSTINLGASIFVTLIPAVVVSYMSR